ncbi:hypothetical protein [Absidia glauca]|uniref:Uncharacterized protein n=1 Tax=Absidia glauca TaxID=4829 RepID=A0A168R7A5_ABSGL|nr:hypothetical protein [Absidia glauca]
MDCTDEPLAGVVPEISTNVDAERTEQSGIELEHEIVSEGTEEQFEDTDPINFGQPTTDLNYVQRTSLKLFALKLKCNLSRAQTKMVSDFVDDLLDEFIPGFKCLSQHSSKQLLHSLCPVKPVSYDICRRGCFLFDSEVECPKCHASRYKTEGPLNTPIIGNPARQMKSLLYHSHTRNLLLNNFDNDTDVYKDIFDGSIFKGCDRSASDLFIGLYIDGFFTNNKQSQSLELIQLVLYNFPPSIRYKNDMMMKSFKLHTLVFTGDMLAVAPLAGHLGHNSMRPCRICTVPFIPATSTIPKIPKHLPIFASGIPSVRKRTIQDFHAGDENAQFEKDLESSRLTIPKHEFHGSFRVPGSRYSVRAVDWIDLVRYVLPALVVPSLSSDAVTAVMAVVRFVQLTQRKRITEEGLLMMDEDLLTWNDFIELMQQNLIVGRNFVTPNHHYLSHVTEAIRQLGPMYSYSARSMERSIGTLKRLIRSKQDSGINGINVMLDLSALAYVELLGDLDLKVYDNEVYEYGDDDDNDDDNDGNDDDDDGNDDSSEDDETTTRMTVAKMTTTMRTTIAMTAMTLMMPMPSLANLVLCWISPIKMDGPICFDPLHDTFLSPINNMPASKANSQSCTYLFPVNSVDLPVGAITNSRSEETYYFWADMVCSSDLDGLVLGSIDRLF